MGTMADDSLEDRVDRCICPPLASRRAASRSLRLARIRWYNSPRVYSAGNCQRCSCAGESLLLAEEWCCVHTGPLRRPCRRALLTCARMTTQGG